MPTYNPLERPDVYKMLAARSLTQLYLTSFFAKASATEYNGNQGFEKGETISIRRPRIKGEAEDYDPRNVNGDPANSSDAGHVVVNLTLSHLFTDGFPTYSHDGNVAMYVNDNAEVSTAAIRSSYEKAAYLECFRDFSSVPASGLVSYAAASPLQIVAAMDGANNTGVNLAPFSASALTNASTVLDRAEVPDGSRYTALSATAKGAFIGDEPMQRSYVAAQAGGAGILTDGLPMGALVSRYGFMVGGTNAITHQSAVANVANSAATAAITAIAQDTAVFFAADYASLTSLGAVKITIGNNWNTAAGGVAVGQIAQIKNAGGTATIAFGVILRISSADIWMVPYSPAGVKMTAAEIPTGAVVSVPMIGSVNVAYHREHLVTAARLLKPPTPNSGAVAVSASDQESGLAMQLIRGSYDVDRFREGSRLAMLCGFKGTDYRKACLVLSL